MTFKISNNTITTTKTYVNSTPNLDNLTETDGDLELAFKELCSSPTDYVKAAKYFYCAGRRKYGAFVESKKLFELSIAYQLASKWMIDPKMLPSLDENHDFTLNWDRIKPEILLQDLQGEELHDLAVSFKWYGFCLQNIDSYNNRSSLPLFKKIYSSAIEMLKAEGSPKSLCQIADIRYNTDRFMFSLSGSDSVEAKIRLIEEFSQELTKLETQVGQEHAGFIREKRAQVFNILMMIKSNITPMTDELTRERFVLVNQALDIALQSENFNAGLKVMFMNNKGSLGLECLERKLPLITIEEVRALFKVALDSAKELKNNHTYHISYWMNVGKLALLENNKDLAKSHYQMAVELCNDPKHFESTAAQRQQLTKISEENSLQLTGLVTFSLSDDAWLATLSHCDIQTIGRLARCSHKMNQICASIWKSRLEIDFPEVELNNRTNYKELYEKQRYIRENLRINRFSYSQFEAIGGHNPKILSSQHVYTQRGLSCQIVNLTTHLIVSEMYSSQEFIVGNFILNHQKQLYYINSTLGEFKKVPIDCSTFSKLIAADRNLLLILTNQNEYKLINDDGVVIFETSNANEKLYFNHNWIIFGEGSNWKIFNLHTKIKSPLSEDQIPNIVKIEGDYLITKNPDSSLNASLLPRLKCEYPSLRSFIQIQDDSYVYQTQKFEVRLTKPEAELENVKRISVLKPHLEIVDNEGNLLLKFNKTLHVYNIGIKVIDECRRFTGDSFIIWDVGRIQKLDFSMPFDSLYYKFKKIEEYHLVKNRLLLRQTSANEGEKKTISSLLAFLEDAYFENLPEKLKTGIENFKYKEFEYIYYAMPHEQIAFWEFARKPSEVVENFLPGWSS